MPHKDPEVARAYWLARRQTETHKTYQRELRKRKHAENPASRVDGQLRYNYGIGIEQYNEMFAAQAGSCAICEVHQTDLSKRLAVDHCHRTGAVRGLLCTNCNTAIGKLKDSKKLLERAIGYLSAAEARAPMPAPRPKKRGRPAKAPQLRLAV
jgi:hypothetical protein